MTASPLSRTLAAIAAAALASVGLVFGLAGPASAATTINVPADYATIQAAVTAAAVGDTVSVAAGTYTENVTVPSSISLVGADRATTKIIGTVTLNAPTFLSNFDIAGQAAVPAWGAGGPDPIVLGAGGAGSVIVNNNIRNGQHGVYASGVHGSAALTTIIQSNYMTGFHAASPAAVWAFDSSFINVQANIMDDAAAPPIDPDYVGVNIGYGSHDINIAGNVIQYVGNALVVLAPGDPIYNISFVNNEVHDTASSALYIGGNNITDVTITGNTITDVGGATNSAIVFTAGYTGNPNAWINPDGPPLSGILIQNNTIGPASFGVTVRDGVLLASNTSIVSQGNTYTGITINSIVGAQAADGPCVTTKDDIFNGSAYILNVCAANTPALAATGAVEPATPMIVATVFGLLGIIAVTFVAYRRRRA